MQKKMGKDEEADEATLRNGVFNFNFFSMKT